MKGGCNHNGQKFKRNCPAAKTISPEVHAWAYDKYACTEMDFVGEAYCKVGTQYFPRYGDLAVGEEKQIWEEVIELGNRFHELRPEKI